MPTLQDYQDKLNTIKSRRATLAPAPGTDQAKRFDRKEARAQEKIDFMTNPKTG